MNAVKALTVRPRFRRQITSIMLVLSLSMGAIVATPTSAHAASFTVVGAFQMTGNFPSAGCFCSSDVAGANVEVMVWSGTYWYPAGNYTLNNLGRLALNTTGYVAMRVNHGRLMSGWLIFGPGYLTFQQARVYSY